MANIPFLNNASFSANATFAGNITLSSGSLDITGASGINTVGKFQSGSGSTTSYLQLLPNGATDTNSGYIGYDTSNLLKFYTQNTLALTLDATQNATFAGSVTLNGEIYGRTSAAFPGLGGLGFYSLVPYLENANQGGLKIQVQQGASLVDALTLDSSQNSTFAGTVTTNKAVIALGSLPALQASSIFIDSPTATINRLGVTGANTTTKGTFVISLYR